MNVTLDKLSKAILILENAHFGTPNPASPFGRKKHTNIYEKERQACADIKEILSNWYLPNLQRLDLNRMLSLLFLCLDHLDSSIRILADHGLDAIFRKFQLKFQVQRVIAILLTELSKKYSARCLCAALNKLALTVHLSRSHRAGIYGYHFMNSMCSALQRPEESIQLSIEKNFPIIFSHVGPLVGPHVEKAEELFQIALKSLDLSGASNRAGSVVIAELSKCVPSILHKSFYKLSGIIFVPDENEQRPKLTGSLITFRLMWETVICNMSEISLDILHKLFCKVLCCLFSSHNEVVIAALELMDTIISFTPYSILTFQPFFAEKNNCSSVYTSLFWPNDKKRNTHPIDGDVQSTIALSADADDINELTQIFDNELNKSLDSFKGRWDSVTDVSTINSLLENEGSIIEQCSKAMSQSGEESFNDTKLEIPDPLLNCDNYLSVDDELTVANVSMSIQDGMRNDTLVSVNCGEDVISVKIPEYLPDDFCNKHNIEFCTYSCLLVAHRFLLAGLGRELRDNRESRISHKILAFKFLTSCTLRNQKSLALPIVTSYGQQYLTDAYGFVHHDDDNLVIAALNLLLSAEKSFMLISGKSPQAGKILSLLSKVLQKKSAVQLKGIFQVFANCSQLLTVDDQLLAAACECAISTFQCDYFLIKVARIEFFSTIVWAKTSAHCREFYQPKCIDILLSHIFDSDCRVVNAACFALSNIVKNAEFFADRTQLFYHLIPDWFSESGLPKIPMVLGMHAKQYFFRCEPINYFLERNLSYIIQKLHALALLNLNNSQSGFLAGLAELCRRFPPAQYPKAYLSSTVKSFPGSPQQHRLFTSNLLEFLLEISNGSCSSITELINLSRIISAIFAGIAENNFTLTDQILCTKNVSTTDNVGISGLNHIANFLVDNQILEQILIFYMRVLNLHYTVVAEEKTRNNQSNTFSFFSGSATIGSPAVDKLSDLARQVTGQDGNSTFSKKTSSYIRNSTRMNNFSYLVGVGICQSRPTSYLQSPFMKNIESIVSGAYKIFLDTLNPEAHRKFLEPLEAAIDGFCIIMEMVDFSLIKTFLDEVLLYLKMLFDISVHSSANLIHQFLKSIFSKNARFINCKVFQSLRVKEPYLSNNFDALDMYLVRSVNEFTIFSAFISRPEYLEIFLLRNAGWFHDNLLQKNLVTNILDLSDFLHLFDPFITRFIHIYALTNSVNIRTSILELLCTLLLNDVRYELVDKEKTFYNRVITQIKQLFCEDILLLGSIFTFLVTLLRVSYVTFSEVESYLVEVMNRVEECNVIHVLEAVHVVLLESLRNFVHCNGSVKTETELLKIRPQEQIQKFLCREFTFLFEQCPKAVSHLWILLLNGVRVSGDTERWFQISIDFLTHFDKFVVSKKLSKRLLSGSKKTEANNLFGLTVVFSCCSPSVFRPIDQFCGSIETIFNQLSSSIDLELVIKETVQCANKKLEHSFPNSPLRQHQLIHSWPENQTVTAISHALPYFFVLFCQLDEEVVFLRLNTISNNPVEYFGSNILNALLSLIKVLRSHDMNWLEENCNYVEDMLCFFSLLLIQASRASKFQSIINDLRFRLITKFSDESDNMLMELGQSFPKAHAYMFALLLALDVRCLKPNFIVCDTYLSHTKSIVCILLIQRICDFLADVTNKSLNESFLSELFLVANEEFCVRFIKWAVNLSVLSKILEFFKKFPMEVVQYFIAKLEHFFSINYIDHILPIFCECLSMFSTLEPIEKNIGIEDRKSSSITARNLLKVGELSSLFSMCLNLSDKIVSVKKIILNKKSIKIVCEQLKARNSKHESINFEFLTLNLNDFDFFCNVALHAVTDSELLNICNFLQFFSSDQILVIIEKVPNINRTKFFYILFDYLNSFTHQLIKNSYIKYVNGSSDSCCYGFSDSTAESAGTDLKPNHKILEAIFMYLAKTNIKSDFEVVCILANISSFEPKLYNFKTSLFNAECVERLFNNLITYLAVKKLDKKIISIEYFVAIRFFFNFMIVSHVYKEDYHLLENLSQFLILLWDETLNKISFFLKAKICRWKHLTADKNCWNIEIDASTGSKLDLLRDDVVQMFNIVQKIVHVFRNNLIKESEIELAFKAIIRLPLLAKMCIVPESALRLNWSLIISEKLGSIHIPLVNIYMLNEPTVLADFVWRVLWLGWLSKIQFEETWMSLFGVLSSTPTGPEELAIAVQNQTLFQQIQASSIAIEALTNLLVLSLLYPNPGNTVRSTYLIKHRSRQEDYLFLDTWNGRLASGSKYWLNINNCESNVYRTLLLSNPSTVFTQNLECVSTWNESSSWCNLFTNYGFSQTSVDYLWSITGLLSNDSQNILKPLKPSPSQYLIEKSTAFDTTSSLKALFENYFHWCLNGLKLLPISLLSAMLKSLSLLTDLVNDLNLYITIFGKLKILFDSKHLDESHPSRGFAIYLLFKCASVIEWKDLYYEAGVSSEADFAKYLTAIAESGLRRTGAANLHFTVTQNAIQHPHLNVLTNQRFLFVSYATMHGILYLMQSLALDNLTNLIIFVTDFVMEELYILQHPADILTYCSPATIEYHKMVWTLAFRIVGEALPINVTHKTNFLKLVCNLFVDPRLPTWHKKLLTHGIESLVVHSCSFSAGFRQTALECFDTCQLRPSHLPFALSVYATCLYREFAEGGECLYEINKSFNRDFQKLINIFLFYSTSRWKCDLLSPVLADLISLAWGKEFIINSIWELIAPISSANSSSVPVSLITHVSGLSKKCNTYFNDPLGANMNTNDNFDISISDQKLNNFEEACNPTFENKPTVLTFQFCLSQFDRALLILFHKIIVRLGDTCRRTIIELCWDFLLPKLSNITDPKFAQFLAMLIMGSASEEPRVQQRLGWFFQDEYSYLILPFSFAMLFFNSFILSGKAVKGKSHWTSENLLKLLTKVNVKSNLFPLQHPKNQNSSDSFAYDQQRVSCFK